MISGFISEISFDDYCCMIVRGNNSNFVIMVNRMIHRPIFMIPMLLVIRNKKSMI